MNTQSDARVTFRVDKDLKEQADILFERMGLNMSTALNVFLRKAVEEEAIPFTISAKGAGFGRSQSVSDITTAFKTAVTNEISKNQRCGYPVARYDSIKKRAYLEAADGSREYVDE